MDLAMMALAHITGFLIFGTDQYRSCSSRKLRTVWSLKSAANNLCCFASLSNPATIVPTAMVGGSNSSSAVGSRNESGGGPSSSEALFGVVASDDGSVWVKSGSGVITCGLEAGKLGISSQSSSKSVLIFNFEHLSKFCSHVSILWCMREKVADLGWSSSCLV